MCQDRHAFVGNAQLTANSLPIAAAAVARLAVDSRPEEDSLVEDSPVEDSPVEDSPVEGRAEMDCRLVAAAVVAGRLPYR